MYKNKYFLLFIPTLIIILFFYLNFFEKNYDNINTLEKKHNLENISDIQNKENYAKVGINPDNYLTFGDFLNDFKSFSGVSIDPLNEKFVIGLKQNNGDILYIPFDYKKNGSNFEDKNNKDLAILDIYKAYKSYSIYGGFGSKYKNQILFESDFLHPKTLELNKIFSANLDKDNSVYDKIKTLEKSNGIGLLNKEFLAYLYDFVGDYNEANKERENICDLFSENCGKTINLKVNGTVFDGKGNPLKGAKVELLNNDLISTLTNDDGTFFLEFKYSNFSHLRFRTLLNGYTDGYITLSINNTYSKELNYSFDFTLNKSDATFVINDSNFSNYKKGKYYVIKTDYSKYFIPIDGFYFENGSNYKGRNIEVYTYLLKKTTNVDSMLENDTFEPVYGFVGNIMKTFGMPYIQFLDKDTGQELFIKSSNPMILQNQIYHMKELYENYDKIYEALTEEDMKFLVNKSEELGGYPIDFNFLVENGILRWPAWWVLDRKTGVWHNVGAKVINIDGLVELPFYHLDDK